MSKSKIVNIGLFFFYACLFVVFVLFCIVVTGLESSDDEVIEKTIIQEIPEQYHSNKELLIKDYQVGIVSPEIVIQILLIWYKDNEGIFLPMKDIDPYDDKWYIHRENHETLQLEKRRRWELNE